LSKSPSNFLPPILDKGHECLLEALLSSQKVTDYSGLSALLTVKWKRK
jgi:hypothetical protein